MYRLLYLCLLLIQLCLAPCAVAAPKSWEVVDGPYSLAAASSLYDWIDSQSWGNPSAPISHRDRDLLYNLVKGSLIWAFSYGNSFDSHDFLLHFANKDATIKLSPLENGGLLFTLETAFFKISQDRRSAESIVFPENDKSLYPRERWFASICNSSSEIMFYFSAVGPFSSWTLPRP